MSSLVDISGIDKVALLRALWERSPVAAFYKLSNMPPPGFDAGKAGCAVTSYIDYFQGRVIKTDLSGDVAHPGMYDRDVGAGAFASVVAALRAGSSE